MSNEDLLRPTQAYYADLIHRFGPIAEGVDWTERRQRLRFKQFDYLWGGDRRFSVNDIGCGYGALFDYLERRGFDLEYCGVDIVPEMLEEGRNFIGPEPRVTWHEGEEAPSKRDYAVASGTYNVKNDAPLQEWHEYVLDSIDSLARSCHRGFALNLLSMHSDLDRREDRLYYADPGALMNHIYDKKISRQMLVVQNYGLYEFTICVWL